MPGSSCATTIKRPFVVPCMGGAVAPGGRGPARFYGRRAVAASKVRGEDGDAGAAPSPGGAGASPYPAALGGEGDTDAGGEARVSNESSDRGPEPLGRDLDRVVAARDRDGTGQKLAGGAERLTVEDHLGFARRGVDDEEALLIGLEPPAAVSGRGGAGGDLLGRGGRHRRPR